MELHKCLLQDNLESRELYHFEKKILLLTAKCKLVCLKYTENFVFIKQ